MAQFSECVFVRSSSRSEGIRWLKDNELSGYVLPPENEWVRVFPQWEHVPDEETIDLLVNSSGLLLYCYFAEQQYWAASLYHRGSLDFRYEAVWLVDEYAVDGKSTADVAALFDVDVEELNSTFRSPDSSPSWEELVDDAIRFADLLGLPGDIWMTVDEALSTSPDTDAEDVLVGPGFGYGLEEPVANGEAHSMEVPSEPSAQNDDAPQSEEPAATTPQEDAPWQSLYELAANFLRKLEDDELIEWTLDSQLARDRLTERLTNLIIENPVSRDSQVIEYWFDELLECPEVVDIFATDEMLEDAYFQAKDEVE